MSFFQPPQLERFTQRESHQAPIPVYGDAPMEESETYTDERHEFPSTYRSPHGTYLLQPPLPPSAPLFEQVSRRVEEPQDSVAQNRNRFVTAASWPWNFVRGVVGINKIEKTYKPEDSTEVTASRSLSSVGTTESAHDESDPTLEPKLGPRRPPTPWVGFGGTVSESGLDKVRPPTRQAFRIHSEVVRGWSWKSEKEKNKSKASEPKNIDLEGIATRSNEPQPSKTELVDDARLQPNGAVPDVSQGEVKLDSNNELFDSPTPPHIHPTKPTCSLNLICYRPGREGCVLQQVRVIKESLCEDKNDFEKYLKANTQLIQSDEKFFECLRDEYRNKMCGFARRYMALRTLRKIRLLTYKPNQRPTVVPLDDFTLQEILYAYNHPSTITTSDSWIDWVFSLRQEDCRHALEFVEGWSGFRIGILGSIPIFASTLVGITWAATGGDPTTAFTVAAFILTVGTAMLALLAIICKVET